MVEAKPLGASVAVRGQMRPEDMEAAAREGFRSILNNRPDGEEPGQPTSAEIEAAARAAGLDYRHVPMTPGQLDPDLIARNAETLAALPEPVLAFCRTGTRSTMLWACARVGDLGTEGVLETAQHAGYDLAQLRPLLGSLAG